MTSFDNGLDRLSINPRFQAFEKFISGMYLGEITRNILVSLIDATPRSLLFGGKATSVINTQWGLDTSVMSDIEEAYEGGKGKGKGKEHSLMDDVPSFITFYEKELTAEEKTRLERVKSVVVKSMEYAEADVSLKDAAVRLTPSNFYVTFD
jgi:hexokinase